MKVYKYSHVFLADASGFCLG